MGQILYIADIDTRVPSMSTDSIRVVNTAGGFAELGSEVTLMVARGHDRETPRARSGDPLDLHGIEHRFDIHRVPVSGIGTRAGSILFGLAARRLGRRRAWELVLCQNTHASVALARGGVKHVFEAVPSRLRGGVEPWHLPVLRSPLVQRVVLSGSDQVARLVGEGLDQDKIVVVPDTEDVGDAWVRRARRILECLPPERPPRRRVLHIISSFAPLIGGAERQVEELSRLQVRAGDEVEVLTRRRRGLPELDGMGPVGVRRVGAWFLGGPGFLLAALGWTLRRRGRFDVLHAHQARTPAVVAALARRLGGPPAVALLVGGDVPDGRDFRSRGRLLALRIVDRVAAVSDALAGAARAAGLENVEVVPTGVDTATFAPAADRAGARRELGLRDGELLVLYVGRLEPVKGVDVLCEAWPAVASICPQARLAIVGRGSLQLSPTHPSMTLVGRVPDTRCYYQAADLLVQPSRSEGLSIVLLEGMACGLAIVATAVPGNLEVIESEVSGVLVPPAEPGPLAAAIQELLMDAERRRRLGAGARAAVLDRFRLEAVEERWAKVYASLA